MLAARRLDKLKEVEAYAAAHGVKAVSVPTDVSVSADCRRLVETCVETFGRVDILVNNAGISARESLYDYKEEDFEKITDLNLNAVFRCSKAAAVLMKEQGGRRTAG